MNRLLDEPLEGMAERLTAARRDGAADVALAPDALADPAQARAVQWRAVSYMGQDLAGYKIGATSAKAQEIIGCSEPFYGQMFAPACHAAPAVLVLPAGARGLECEFAFRMAGDPGGGGACTAQMAAGAVELCCPAIELVARRSAGDGFPGLLPAIADFGLNGAFVHGEPIENWHDIDIDALAVVATVDGAQTNRGSASAVLGHPLNALAWLVNALHRDGHALKKGDWVSTGTCLGVVPAKPDTRVRAAFGPDHALEVALTGY